MTVREHAKTVLAAALDLREAGCSAHDGAAIVAAHACIHECRVLLARPSSESPQAGLRHRNTTGR